MGGPIGLDSSDDDAAGCGAAANAMHARVLLGGELLGRDPRQPASTLAFTAAATIPGTRTPRN